MVAVESLCHRLGHGTGLEIFREHVRPRDGLEHGPMPVNRRQQRDDQEDMTDFMQHNVIF
jgi:hypothetical protein